MDTNMTLDDIIAAMRAGVVPPHQRDEELLAFLADCFEAAAKRERDVATENAFVCITKDPPGSAAALRAALVKTLDAFKSGAIRTEWNDPDSWKHDDELWYLKNDIESALAAPVRNCDVGTADEQARRFQLFCQNHRDIDAECSRTCPFVDTADINHCQAGWSQLPYEGGAD